MAPLRGVSACPVRGCLAAATAGRASARVRLGFRVQGSGFGASIAGLELLHGHRRLRAAGCVPPSARRPAVFGDASHRRLPAGPQETVKGHRVSD